MKLFNEIEKFEQELDSVPEITPVKANITMESLKPYKGAIIIVLNIIKLFTGKKADKKIDQLIFVLNIAL